MRDEMERRIQRYKKMGNFTIEPWDSRYYALFDGNELICVTAYKIGAMEVMKRLTRVRKCQGCPLGKKGWRDQKYRTIKRKGSEGKDGEIHRDIVRGLG